MKNTKSNIDKRNLFSTAWSFFKQGLFNSFANALQAAWRRIKLISNLRHGIAYFSFLKADGQLRQAIGTLAGNNFEYTNKTENHNSKLNLNGVNPGSVGLIFIIICSFILKIVYLLNSMELLFLKHKIFNNP